MEKEEFLIKDFSVEKSQRSELDKAKKQVKVLVNDDMAEITKLMDIYAYLTRGIELLDRLEDAASLASDTTTQDEKRELAQKIGDIKGRISVVINEVSNLQDSLKRDEQTEQKLVEQLSQCVAHFKANTQMIDQLITEIKN
jgi:hypothetical protein